MKDTDKKIIKGMVLMGPFLVDYHESGDNATIYSLGYRTVQFAFDIDYKYLDSLWEKSESEYEFYSLVWREYFAETRKTPK